MADIHHGHLKIPRLLLSASQSTANNYLDRILQCNISGSEERKKYKHKYKHKNKHKNNHKLMECYISDRQLQAAHFPPFWYHCHQLYRWNKAIWALIWTIREWTSEYIGGALLWLLLDYTSDDISGNHISQPFLIYRLIMTLDVAPKVAFLSNKKSYS